MHAVGPKSVDIDADVDADGDEAREYVENVRLLSEGSVRRSFDPYTDIDWDNPEFAVEANEEGWILPAASDVMARHPWYQGLPTEKKIAIGKYRTANMCKVALQNECVLISGMAVFNFGLPVGSPEFEYCTHEMIEEHNHNLMFAELIKRIGPAEPGPMWLRRGRTAGALAAALAPNLFFMIVQVVEDVPDCMQKMILRAGDQVHPLLRNVISIHVAEESRHISFTREFLKKNVPPKNPLSKFVLSMAFPLIIRMSSRVLLLPSMRFYRKFDVPKDVQRQMYGTPEAAQYLSEFFTDSRTLAHEIGLMNPVAKALWKMLRIDGGRSRFRSEPLRRAR
ncbi:diiron oxygenase [Nocardia sp. CNY236]|uniref:AurF N-oxygenase family protein n=1 Tax=Nocardia sp. CNY236 TaxID=1169152 RepID=UPI000686337E|nr:diiron oxygenase [Nocardia sp. CNY236]